VAGIQLDIDSPTGALPKYAAFLRELRKTLPAGVEISITALLDWFRDDTSIADVIQQTDEFVPQFYDVAEGNMFDPGGAIATKFDGARWAPRFNRFQKRFRLGISSFGRASMRPGGSPSEQRSSGVALLRDLTPLDVAANPDFRLETRMTEANELVLNYRAARKTEIGYKKLPRGDAIQFILPTPDAIRIATENA
jgi:Protein of unknown function (DUF3142)